MIRISIPKKAAYDADMTTFIHGSNGRGRGRGRGRVLTASNSVANSVFKDFGDCRKNMVQRLSQAELAYTEHTRNIVLHYIQALQKLKDQLCIPKREDSIAPLVFKWGMMSLTAQKPFQSSSLSHERASALFQVGCINSCLGGLFEIEGRESVESLKRGFVCFRDASRAFLDVQDIFAENAVKDVSSEFGPQFLSACVFMMKAQAQRCAVQKLLLEHSSSTQFPKLVPDLMMQISGWFEQARIALQRKKDSLSSVNFFVNAVVVAEAWARGLALFYKAKSLTGDEQKPNSGLRVGLLTESKTTLESCEKTFAKKFGGRETEHKLLKSNIGEVAVLLQRSVEENDAIYHENVVAASDYLGIIKSTELPMLANPPELRYPEP